MSNCTGRLIECGSCCPRRWGRVGETYRKFEDPYLVITFFGRAVSERLSKAILQISATNVLACISVSDVGQQ
ncbi:MAG: hypothetical protein ACLUE2_06695 [Bacteroides cellulosilyticus]